MNVKGKKAILISLLTLLAYAGLYGCLRLSKQLVHQEVSLIDRTGMRKNGRSVCYMIHHDIGRGSYTDEHNYNKVKSPSTAVQISKHLFYPLVKLEVTYWNLKIPRYIYETVCDQ